MLESFWKKALLVALVIGLVSALSLAWMLRSMTGAGDDPAFFEDEIKAFEEADRESPPGPGRILFIGSSSIRFWSSLEDDMAGLPVLNRGFGGAHLSHVIHNTNRIVVPYAPRAIVLYAGDNDIGAGKSVDRVVGDFEAFVRGVRAQLPNVPIHFLPIKPSKLRWKRWPEMAQANRRIEVLTQADPSLHYHDTASVLLGANGEPRGDVFLLDGLHMNAKGYALWTSVVAPALRAAYAAPVPTSMTSRTPGPTPMLNGAPNAPAK